MPPASTPTDTGHKTTTAGWRLIVLLALLMGLTSLSTDVYLPAMPQMQLDLRGDVELTISGFLIGFALAQLAWGPISDRIGRRPPLLMGMTLFVVGSIGCAMSRTIDQIVFWRLVQALGACTGPMLARAMVRDLYGRTAAARMLSTLTMVMAIAPIIGPLIGGQILRVGSWHHIFWALAGIGLLMMLALAWLPETHGPHSKSRASLGTAWRDYVALLRNPRFIRPTVSVMFFYMGVYAFITGSPAVYIRYFGIAPQHYGWLFGLNIAGVMALSFVNRRLVQWFDLNALLRTATLVAAVAILAGALWAVSPAAGFLAVVLPVFCFMTMNGIVAASATALALDDVPHMAGSASALIGALQYGGGIVPSFVLAWLADGSPAALMWLMAVCAALSAVTALLPVAPRVCQLPTQEPAR